MNHLIRQNGLCFALLLSSSLALAQAEIITAEELQKLKSELETQRASEVPKAQSVKAETEIKQQKPKSRVTPGEVLNADSESSGNGGACFITTAVCGFNGKPDNCYELETLRKFRDTWLTENHPEDIRQYYNEAPVVVSKISVMPEAAEVFNSFDRDYIAPAIEAIELGDNELAYTIYKNLFMTAKEIAQG